VFPLCDTFGTACDFSFLLFCNRGESIFKVSAVACVHVQISPGTIFGGQSGTVTGLFS
jgi:hypothetical protein